MLKVGSLAAASALMMAGFASEADAAYTVTVTEQGGDVVATGAGTINTRAFQGLYASNQSFAPFIQPSTGTLLIGSPISNFNTYYADVSGPQSIGGTTFSETEGAGSGDAVYFNSSGVIGVPSGYFSGSLLTSRAIFANQTFSSVGLTRGTYAFSIGIGTNQDTFTIQVGPAETPVAPSVPEPATWAMMIAGFGLVVGTMRRRKSSVALA